MLKHSLANEIRAECAAELANKRVTATTGLDAARRMQLLCPPNPGFFHRLFHWGKPVKNTDRSVSRERKLFSVALLPSNPQAGDLAVVNDAVTKVFGSVVFGGGSFVASVLFDGRNWIVA